MQTVLLIRLSVMMFLQFFIWGAWYVTAPSYLTKIGFGGTDFGWTYSVGPIAGIISPFFVGMVADRFFSTERVLGVMHLLGGAAMIGATTLMGPDGAGPGAINLVFFGHMLCFFPTLALTNSLSMHNLDDSEKQFPYVRVWGTIGWIIAGWILGALQWGDTVNMFYLAGGAALLLGLYSFSLPHTPPPLKGQQVSPKELVGGDAFVMLKRPSFGVFMASSFLICIPLAFYYQLGERAVRAGGLDSVALDLGFLSTTFTPPIFMSFGQVSEIVFMLLMPLFFVRLGVKWMLFVGMLAWVARYGLFAVGAPADVRWMMLTGVVLHGICYDFFFVTGQIYTDKSAPAGIRSQAQGMLVLFTLGLGMLIGAQIGGFVEAAYTPPETGWLNAEAAAVGKRTKALKKQLEDAESQQAEQTDESDSKAESLDVAGFTGSVDSKLSAVDERLESANEELDAARNAAAARRTWPEFFVQFLFPEVDEEVQQAAAARDEALQEKVAALDDQAQQWAREHVQSDADASLLQARIALLEAYQGRQALAALNAIDWRSIWTIPAAGAAVVMVLFGLLFHDQITRDDEHVTEGDVAEAAAEEEMM